MENQPNFEAFSPPHKPALDISSLSPMQSPQFWGQYPLPPQSFAQQLPMRHLDPIDILVDQRLGGRGFAHAPDRAFLSQQFAQAQSGVLAQPLLTPHLAPQGLQGHIPHPLLGRPEPFPPQIGQGLYMPKPQMNVDFAPPVPLPPLLPPVPDSWSLMQQTPEHWGAGQMSVGRLRTAPPAPNWSPQRRDPVAIDLSQRLASIDAVVRGLSVDIADLSTSPKDGKQLHKL